jgi:hypothetical protein
MTAKIYQPAKTAMQSGQAKTRWRLEFDQATARRLEPLMGWTSAADTRQQLNLHFESCEAAVAFAEKHGIAYRIERPHSKLRRSLSYSDNFRFDRKLPWTH